MFYYVEDYARYVAENTIRYYENKKGDEFTPIADILVREFKKHYITKGDEKLMDFIFNKTPDQKELDDFLKNWDIEEHGGGKSLILSYFMKSHPELAFSNYNKPRLDGLLQYYKFDNLRKMSYFTRICKKIKEKNVDILVLKGGTMKYYRPDFPRLMGDIDILLKSKRDYEIAKEIVKSFNYKYTEYGHSLDVYEETGNAAVLDIHHKLDTLGSALWKDKMTANLFKRANRTKYYGLDGIYVTGIEDTLFITLINLVKNMTRGSSQASILHAVFECKYLMDLKPDINWNIIKENARITKTKGQLHLGIKFVNQFIPKKIPEFFKEDLEDFPVMFFYNNCFLSDLKDKKESMKEKNLSERALFCVKYYLYKRKAIRKSPKLIRVVLKGKVRGI